MFESLRLCVSHYTTSCPHVRMSASLPQHFGLGSIQLCLIQDNWNIGNVDCKHD